MLCRADVGLKRDCSEHEIGGGNIAAVHAVQHDCHRKIHVIGGDAVRDEYMGFAGLNDDVSTGLVDFEVGVGQPHVEMDLVAIGALGVEIRDMVGAHVAADANAVARAVKLGSPEFESVAARTAEQQVVADPARDVIPTRPTVQPVSTRIASDLVTAI